MPFHASVVMLGVQDLDRAKAFYVDGMGAELQQDFPGFARCTLGGETTIALYDWNAHAQDAGVPAEGSGFRGVSFHYLTDTRDEVDQVLAAATAAGGAVVKPAVAAEWGGYDGWFSDPDGYLWKVATAS